MQVKQIQNFVGETNPKCNKDLVKNIDLLHIIKDAIQRYVPERHSQ